MSQPEAIATISMPQTPIRNGNDPVVSEKVGINKKYLFSIRSYLRILLIVFLTVAWIIGITIQKNPNYLNFIFDIFTTRFVYIIITAVADVISILIFIFFLINLDNISPVDRINVGFIVLVFDTIFFTAMLGLAVACAIYETTYDTRLNENLSVNKGSFAAAATFAFLSMILYLVSCVLEIKQTLRIRRMNITRS